MRRTRAIRSVVIVLCLGLVAAACSDDGGDAEATDDAEAATATTEQTPDANVDEMAPPDDSGPTGNIVETAVAAGDFTTLATALESAGLIETLTGDGPFTVFAPTDEAFQALPPGTLDELLADPDALADVLLYHVVEGEVLAADVVELDSATTVQGSDVSITTEGSTVRVDDATVTMPDVQASNGVIHVIDTVLLPPSS